MAQNDMLLWMDDETSDDVEEAVSRAKSYFRGKYGVDPETVIENYPVYHYLLGPIPKRLTIEQECGIIQE